MKKVHVTLNGLTLLALILWTTTVIGSLWWGGQTLQRENVALASAAALSDINKDMSIKLWAASHGGVYLPLDANTQPNPYLTQPTDRKAITTEGKHLFLMDPASILRQVMGQSTHLFGAQGRITSLNPTNPVNKPDAWEKTALESFSKGAKEATIITDIDGKPYFRMIHPLFMQEDCMQCHADRGVKVGEVRGGISVSIPMQPITTVSTATNKNIDLFYSLFWLFGVCLIALIAVTSKRVITERTRAELAEELAGRDGLTGLYNHSKFYTLLQDEIVRTQRYGRSMSLLMLDIDYFKRVNDTYGHQAGDIILTSLSDLLVKQARTVDRVCRYGGEEITVILPETDSPVAMNIAERLRAGVALQQFAIGEGKSVDVTVSIGVATYSQDLDSPEKLVKAADTALYSAKTGGRNRVCLYEPNIERTSA